MPHLVVVARLRNLEILNRVFWTVEKMDLPGLLQASILKGSVTGKNILPFFASGDIDIV